MSIGLIDSIRKVDPDAWDSLLDNGYPFARHGFLSALEESGSASRSRGWQPCHLILEEGGLCKGAVPLYLKSHSRGEFVFDWVWADAYQRMGRSYYPKLVSAIPFTPATGPRLLAASDEDRATLARGLREQVAELNVSSAHTLFPGDRDMPPLREAGFLERRNCSYRWHNDGYRDFEHFLTALSASKRKKIRRERRRVTEAGITMEVRSGNELSESLWQEIYGFYANTYLMRGQRPYLNLEFWLALSERMGDRLIVFIAHHDHRPVAVALTLRDDEALYGRHWGCAKDYHSLHFEACYYQGIQYCIEQGLTHFDAGIQGPHKINRGFMPYTTRSAHWIADPTLRGAIDDFLGREGEIVDRNIAEQQAHSPFREITNSG